MHNCGPARFKNAQVTRSHLNTMNIAFGDKEIYVREAIHDHEEH